MDQVPVGEITVLLQASKAGQPGALDRLFALVYDELRKIAKNRLGAVGNWAAEPTTLVHEAYLRLIKHENATWEDRHHFFWSAARAMRDILVERARRDGALKHGGGRKRVELREDSATVSELPDLLDLNDAVLKLEAVHPKAAKVVMLQFFSGLNRDAIAEVLNISPAAVWREWSFARAWLRNQLEDEVCNTK